MRSTFRIVGLSAGLAVLLALPAPAGAASFFKKRTGKTSIEVHVDDRRIIYLHLDAPIRCSGGATGIEEIADTRTPIPVQRRTGAFSFIDEFRKGDEYAKAVVKGVIRRGRLDGEYRFVHIFGNGDSCWSGESIQGTPEAPEGSAVALSVSRKRGVRFFKDSSVRRSRSATTYLPGSFPHIVYMWVGNGRAYGLTAIVRETCVTRQAGFPPSTNRYDLVLARKRAVRVDPATHEIQIREARRTGTGPDDREVWRLDAEVSRRRVQGDLSHTYDYRYAGGTDTLHCQTGGRGSPRVDFDAVHG